MQSCPNIGANARAQPPSSPALRPFNPPLALHRCGWTCRALPNEALSSCCFTLRPWGWGWGSRLSVCCSVRSFVPRRLLSSSCHRQSFQSNSPTSPGVLAVVSSGYVPSGPLRPPWVAFLPFPLVLPTLSATFPDMTPPSLSPSRLLALSSRPLALWSSRPLALARSPLRQSAPPSASATTPMTAIAGL